MFSKNCLHIDSWQCLHLDIRMEMAIFRHFMSNIRHEKWKVTVVNYNVRPYVAKIGV